MIKSNNGLVEVKGTNADILTDLTCIIATLKEELPEYLLKDSITLGLIDNREEFMKQELERKKRVLKELKDLLEELKNGRNEFEEE